MEHNLMMTLCAFGVMATIIAMVAILESIEDDQDVDDHHKALVQSVMHIHECSTRSALARKERIGQRRHEFKSRWAYPRPQMFLERALMATYSDHMFKSRLHISHSTYSVLVARLGPFLQRQDTNFRKAVIVEKRVAVAMHRLASGANLQVIADLYGILISTTQKIVIDFCDAIHNSDLRGVI
ncbi:hypothetical protein L7F22_047269 [Adiantum nelumboides]|nr:hypothetical protein [Adiantum nelumboides]